jgi:hypothetical protein
MSKTSAKIREELDALIPPTIYFFVALNIIALIHALLLKGTGIEPSTPLEIAVAALILGKAVLLADLLPAINRYPEKPLIYNVLWKTLIYSVVATLIPLRGASHRLLAGGRRFRSRQPPAARANCVGPLLGPRDHNPGAGLHLLSVH